MRDHFHFIKETSIHQKNHAESIGRKEKGLFLRLKQYLGMFMWNYLDKWNKTKKPREKNELLNMLKNWL